MRPPIVIDENGDISFFSSVEAAARKIEPIDVRNNEYVGYDSKGFILRLVPTEPVVSIVGYASEFPQPEQLTALLRSFVKRVTGQPVPSEVTSLEQLLGYCIRKVGYTV